MHIYLDCNSKRLLLYGLLYREHDTTGPLFPKTFFSVLCRIFTLPCLLPPSWWSKTQIRGHPAGSPPSVHNAHATTAMHEIEYTPPPPTTRSARYIKTGISKVVANAACPSVSRGTHTNMIQNTERDRRVQTATVPVHTNAHTTQQTSAQHSAHAKKRAGTTHLAGCPTTRHSHCFSVYTESPNDVGVMRALFVYCSITVKAGCAGDAVRELEARCKVAPKRHARALRVILFLTLNRYSPNTRRRPTVYPWMCRSCTRTINTAVSFVSLFRTAVPFWG